MTISYLWLGFSGGSEGKEFACNAGDLGLIPGLGRSSGEGNGYPLQYSGLGNSMDRGVWQATGHGVTKSQIRLSNWHFPHKQHYLWTALYSLLNLFPPERNGDVIKQDGLFETEILALLLTSYISLDKLLEQLGSQLETDGILKLGNWRGLIKGQFIKIWEHTGKPQRAKGGAGYWNPVPESCVERPLGRTCDLWLKGPISPLCLQLREVRGRHTPSLLPSLLHIWKGKLKITNNYLNFLSLIFLICEKENNNISLSEFLWKLKWEFIANKLGPLPLLDFQTLPVK